MDEAIERASPSLPGVPGKTIGPCHTAEDPARASRHNGSGSGASSRSPNEATSRANTGPRGPVNRSNPVSVNF
jgi:hypothetical protein